MSGRQVIGKGIEGYGIWKGTAKKTCQHGCIYMVVESGKGTVKVRDSVWSENVKREIAIDW